MANTAKISPVVMTTPRIQHASVLANIFFAKAGAVDNADTRAAYQQGYIDCAEADRHMDGAGNFI